MSLMKFVLHTCINSDINPSSWHAWIAASNFGEETCLNIVNKPFSASLEFVTDEGRILDELDIVTDTLLEPAKVVRKRPHGRTKTRLVST
jgi:hypothetical protein